MLLKGTVDGMNLELICKEQIAIAYPNNKELKSKREYPKRKEEKQLHRIGNKYHIDTIS